MNKNYVNPLRNRSRRGVGAALLALLLIVALPVAAAFALNSGFLAPTAYTNGDGGSDTGWLNPQNGLTSDNLRATVSISAKTVQYHGFTFPSLGAGATIDGIEVSVEGNTGGRQAEVELSWDGGVTWTTGAGTGVKTTALPIGPDGVTSLGGPTDKWGVAHTWVPADFSGSPNTSFHIRLTSLVGGAGIAVDQVEVKIYYSAPSATLTYLAGAHGSISGTTPQTVPLGGNGTAVTAVPNAGYHFVNWSDASTANPRTDMNVTGDITVTANFAADSFHLFDDVPVAGKEWMEPWIVAFYNAGITTGCGTNPLIFCPEANVTRAELAVFLLRAEHGAGYVPPAASHFFSDMPVAGKEWMEPWVDQFYREGLTSGCDLSPLKFCPSANATRAEIAVFILRAEHGASYVPPAASHFFSDMPVAGKEWMEPWVDQFYREGITSGCDTSPLKFCPSANATRAEIAVFIDRAYHLYP